MAFPGLLRGLSASGCSGHDRGSRRKEGTGSDSLIKLSQDDITEHIVIAHIQGVTCTENYNRRGSVSETKRGTQNKAARPEMTTRPAVAQTGTNSESWLAELGAGALPLAAAPVAVADPLPLAPLLPAALEEGWAAESEEMGVPYANCQVN